MSQIRPETEGHGRVYLKKDEKERVAREVVRLQMESPGANLTSLLKRAIRILGPDRQPTVNSASEDRWAWLRARLLEIIEEMKAEPPAPPLVPVVPVERVAVAQVSVAPRPAPPPEPEAEPMPLTAAETAARIDLAVGAGLDDPEADEREEWAAIVAMRRARSRDRDLAGEIAILRKTVVSLGATVQALRAELNTLPERIGQAAERIARATATGRPVAEPTPGTIAKPGALNGRAVGLPTAAIAPPKPRVMVVGYSSGHQIKGVETEVAGRAVLRFTKADMTFPRYADCDYIVATKEAPTSWVAGAKEKYPKERLVVFSGNAQEVGRKVATLAAPAG